MLSWLPMQECPTISEAAREAPSSGRRRTRTVVIAGLALVIGAAVAVVLARDRLFARRFAMVEPGLYRGAYADSWALRRIVDRHGIKTILCLADFGEDDPRLRAERAVASEKGVDQRVVPMPGNGVAPPADLDAAADIIANPANRPIFVHCVAGVQRTNAVIAAYRMKHCGWTCEQAIAECERYWLRRDRNPELYEHLETYSRYLTSPDATSQPATLPVDGWR